jgi:hypothetical protein
VVLIGWVMGCIADGKSYRNAHHAWAADPVDAERPPPRIALRDSFSAAAS